MPARKLLRNALRPPEDISRVRVVISHKRLTAELSISRRIIEPPRDLVLQVDVERVSGAPGHVMQIRPQPQQEIVGSFDPSLVAFGQPIFPDELVCAQRTLFEISHPKQILVITQSATSALQVRL